ncbi:MAG: RluA family pseudouridine synthase [Actinobacteria bacterium]|nr:MAG: RluA family pseudouridine synthase [Actinomycetota bacterium]TML84579.1 MAG: RluA family pseudouridine synthase [Actinomycetota bacterium]
MKQRVPDEAAGERLDRFLASLPEVGSRGVAQRLLESGKVLVDGRPLDKSRRLTGGEELEFEPPTKESAELEPEQMDLRIVYEDEYLLVVDKPAGLVVHPGSGHATGTLVQGLLEHDAAGGDAARPGIVHRLDRDTSGLMVVARSNEAHARLQALVRNRAIERHYAALVVGKPRSRAGRIEAPIGRDRRDPLRHSLDTDKPREAITHFEVRELLPRHTLLDVRLETGRTHQIRVHLAAVDLPVAGDTVYGRPRELDLERQFLHAGRLAFPHPFTAERVDVESPLPADLGAALERARHQS